MKRRRALAISPPYSSRYGTFLSFGSVSSTSAGGECSLSRGYSIAVESLPRLPHTCAATCVHEVRGLLMGPQGTVHGHDSALLCLSFYFFISTGLCWLTTVCCPTREHVLYLTAANRQRSAQRRFPMHLAPELPKSPDARGTMGANGRNRGKGAFVCVWEGLADAPKRICGGFARAKSGFGPEPPDMSLGGGPAPYWSGGGNVTQPEACA